MDILHDLNSEQADAVTSTEGFIRVIAGAGSGKTRALAYRFAYLVNELGILPGNILCVTFTNKSANEMRRRIHKITGDNDTGYICTFHSFCISILQEDSYAVQYPKNFLVLDNSDIDSMLKIIYEERGLTLKNMTFSKARDMIEIRKIFKEPKYYNDMITMSKDTLQQKYLNATETDDIIFYGYLYHEKKCFGLDYNDLIKFTLYIFEENSEIKEKWQKRLEYIMIDEFQDIDNLQFTLMNALCGYHKNLFVVGDPDQTIYTWRGANIKYLMEFDKVFPNTKTIVMTKNYRSAPQILSAANSLIDKNNYRIKKNLIPTLPNGQTVTYHNGENAEKEALYISDCIKELHKNGTPYRDIALLYRAHYVSRIIEQVFLQEQIPYTIYSGVQFFERAEIKDTLSYLRMIAYKDDLSFMRIVNTPKRNIGQSRMKFLQEYSEQHGCTLYAALCQNEDSHTFKGTKAGEFISLIESFSDTYGQYTVSELTAAVLDKSHYEEMLRTEGSQEGLDNLAELKQSIYEYEISCGEESTLEHYLTHTALFNNSDTAEAGDKVKLMTVHTAKGLEFPYVFLCAMNEDIFPSKKVKTVMSMEEERRLAFVAMTRAEKALYLTGADGRNIDNSFRYPSRFIFDINSEYINFTKNMSNQLLTQAKQHINIRKHNLIDENYNSSFKEGDRIKHTVFGSGVILKENTEQATRIILFDKMPTPRTISFKVKIEKI